MKNKRDKLFLAISGVGTFLILIFLAIFRTTDKWGVMILTFLGTMVLTSSLIMLNNTFGLEKPTYEDSRKYLLGSGYKTFER